jgi:hypothetical protein
MTVYEFCKEEARDQFCAIRKDGEIIEVFWVDHGDASCFSETSRNAEVKEAEFSVLPVVNSDGYKYNVPCLFIDI